LEKYYSCIFWSYLACDDFLYSNSSESIRVIIAYAARTVIQREKITINNLEMVNIRDGTGLDF